MRVSGFWPRAAALTLALTLAAGCALAAAPERVSGVGFYFDTNVTVTLYGPEEGLLEEIWAACGQYEGMLSKTVPGSDVDRVNSAGGEPVTVSPETWDILAMALEVNALSGGAFSVTIAPVTALWDFTHGTRRMPTDQELAAALPLVDDSRLILGEGGTVTLPPGMEIDLGGIAKGYIADRIAELCRGRVQSAVLNFGGNVYIVGEKADGSPYRVGVRDPEGTEASSRCVLSVRDVSVVTSGTYERYFDLDGVRYHHILDPSTGYPSRSGLASATVVHKSSMLADAVATACIVLGSDDAMALLDSMDLDAMLITDTGEILTTDGFSEAFQVKGL